MQTARLARIRAGKHAPPLPPGAAPPQRATPARPSPATCAAAPPPPLLPATPLPLPISRTPHPQSATADVWLQHTTPNTNHPADVLPSARAPTPLPPLPAIPPHLCPRPRDAPPHRNPSPAQMLSACPSPLLTSSPSRHRARLPRFDELPPRRSRHAPTPRRRTRRAALTRQRGTRHRAAVWRGRCSAVIRPLDVTWPRGGLMGMERRKGML